MLELLDLRIHAHLLGSATYSSQYVSLITSAVRVPHRHLPTTRVLLFLRPTPQTIRLDRSEAVVSLRPRILRVPKVELSLSQGEKQPLLGSRARAGRKSNRIPCIVPVVVLFCH